MYIVNGKIQKIEVKMPLTYKSSPSEMTIESIDLTVCAISEISSDNPKNTQGDETLKKEKLKIWESKMAKYFESLTPPSWIQKVVDSIYDNMSVIISQFSFTFQNSNLGHFTEVKIKCDVNIYATNSKWERKFNDNSKVIYKKIEILKLSVQMRGKSERNQKYDSTILGPLDITIFLTLSKEPSSLEQPIQNIEIRIHKPIILMLTKEQKNDVVKLTELLSNLQTIQDNFHIRPQIDIKGHYGEWWKYLINAVIQKHKNHKLDLGYSSRKLVLMKRYIQLYKRKQQIIQVPWLNTLTGEEEEARFNQCERHLPLKDLLKYREWAFQEIRIEAKRYYHSSKDGSKEQSVKPLVEIWTNTINNQNSFKDQRRNTDNDIPIELDDDEKINLYEILERDKTQVLSSYLKGQNNDPNQIKMQLTFKIHSVFLLLTLQSMRPESKTVKYSPDNTKIFKSCRCVTCLEKGKKANQQQKSTSIPQQPNQVQQFDQQQIDEEIYSDFHTVKGANSFQSDFEDLEANKQLFDESQEGIVQQAIIKTNNEQQRNNRLFMIISFVAISAKMYQKQSGRFFTDENEPFAIKQIQIVCPSLVPSLMQKNFGHQTQKSTNKSQNQSFYEDVFSVSLTKESIFFNSDACFNNMINFLKLNEMGSMAEFLQQYEMDKHSFNDFSDRDFEENYKKFYDQKEEAHFLHFEQQYMSVNSTLVASTHSKIIELIRRYLFVTFLEEFGDSVMPLCIQNLSNIINSEFVNQDLNQESKFKNDKISIQIHVSITGNPSEYQIVPIKAKKQEKRQSSLEDRQSNKVQITICPFQVLLSTKSLTALLDFIETPDNDNVNQNELFITQYQLLLDCIINSKSLSDYEIQNSNIDFKVSMDQAFDIIILSDQIAAIQKTELILRINNFDAVYTDINNFFPNDDTRKKNDTLINQHTQYNVKKLCIRQLSVIHQFHEEDELDVSFKDNDAKARDKFRSEQRSTILDCAMTILKIDSKIPNHSLLTDSKLYIHFPFLHIEIKDQIVTFLEVMQILNKANREDQDKKQKRYMMSPDSLLKAELQTLYTDHNNSNCKHCIIKYKKSTNLTNILIGTMPEYQYNDLMNSWFDVMGNIFKEGSGFSLKFVNMNRVAIRQACTSNLVIPIILLTRDQGFFKDNITVHCTPSVGQDLRQSLDDQGIRKHQDIETEDNYLLIQPSEPVSQESQLWRRLDDKFIFYFRDLEKRLFKQEFVKESMDNKPQDNNLYLLFYQHKPCKSELINEMENSVRVKELKTQIYFSVNSIKANFKTQNAAFTAMSTINNLQEIAQKIDRVYEIMYGKKVKDYKQVKWGEGPSPIAWVEDFIICGRIKQLGFYQESSYFKITDMQIDMNTDLLLNQQTSAINFQQSGVNQQQQKRQFQSVIRGQDINVQNQRMSVKSIEQEKESVIMQCAEVILNFKKYTFVEVKVIKILKSLISENIQNRTKIALLVQSIKITNQEDSKENLLIVPYPTSHQLVAVQIHISFAEFLELIIWIQPAKFQISQQRIDNMLVAVNTYYQMNLQEQINLEKYLKEHIYLEAIVSKSKVEEIFIIQELNSPGTESSNYVLQLEVQGLTICLQEKNETFFSLLIDPIKVQKKRQAKDLVYEICIIEARPEQKNGVYNNLFTNHLLIKIEESEIRIDDMTFIAISKYLNQLQAFKSNIEKILQKSRNDIQQHQGPEKALQAQQDQYLRRLNSQQKMLVILRNTTIRVPELSTSHNYVQFYSKNSTIQLGKTEEDTCRNIYFEIIDAEFTKVEASYCEHKADVVHLFDSQSIRTLAKLPFYEPNPKERITKDKVDISLSDLTMTLNFNQLNKVKICLDKNSTEESELFELKPKGLEIIDLNLSLQNMNMKVDRYEEIKQEKKPIPKKKLKAAQTIMFIDNP